jgi:hypothetical protein
MTSALLEASIHFLPSEAQSIEEAGTPISWPLSLLRARRWVSEKNPYETV